LVLVAQVLLIILQLEPLAAQTEIIPYLAQSHQMVAVAAVVAVQLMTH
jgi:hypothetical protein